MTEKTLTLTQEEKIEILKSWETELEETQKNKLKRLYNEIKETNDAAIQTEINQKIKICLYWIGIEKDENNTLLLVELAQLNQLLLTKKYETIEEGIEIMNAYEKLYIQLEEAFVHKNEANLAKILIEIFIIEIPIPMIK